MNNAITNNEIAARTLFHVHSRARLLYVVCAQIGSIVSGCNALLRCCCIREYTSLPMKLSYDFCFRFDSIVAVHRRHQSKSHRNKLCMQNILLRAIRVCVLFKWVRCIIRLLLYDLRDALIHHYYQRWRRRRRRRRWRRRPPISSANAFAALVHCVMLSIFFLI